MTTITPVTKTVEKDSIRKTHPAFGMAGFSRVSSTGTKLFGSELPSHSFITFEINEAEEVWHLHEKRFCAKKRILEVSLSASQFAEMLTSMNVGDGVPCTITYRDTIGGVPEFVDNDTLQQQIKDDLKADVAGIVDLTKKLEADLAQVLALSNLSAAKKSLLISSVQKIKQDISQNMPFVLDQYKEAVDKVTASAKAEVESFVMHTVTQLGVKSLQEISEAHAQAQIQ